MTQLTYVIRVENPRHSLSVFVWDRVNKKILVSFPYPELTLQAQQKAKDRCRRWLESEGLFND